MIANSQFEPDMAHWYAGRILGHLLKLNAPKSPEVQELVALAEAAGLNMTHYILNPPPASLAVPPPKKKRKKAA